MQTTLINFGEYRIEVYSRKHWWPWARNVVWIHGFCAPFQDNSRWLNELFRRGYNVYAFNMPGHGATSKVSPSWELLLRMLDHVVTHFRLRRAIFVGYSLGGGLTLKALESGRKYISSARLIAPLVNADAIVHLSTVPELIRHGLRNEQVRREDGVEYPDPMPVDFTWNVEHYAIPIIDFKPDVSKAGVSIKVALHSEDKLINPNEVRRFFSGISNAVVSEVAGLTHDIYYVGYLELRRVLSAIGF